MRDDEITDILTGILTDILTDAYSTLEMLGQDLAATQHRVYYSYDEKVDYEALEVWKRDLRGVQRRIDEVFKLLESK